MTETIKRSYIGLPMNEAEIRELAESKERLNIQLTNDFAFKTTFHNKVALTGLLSALLEIDPAEIRDLEFKDKTLAGEYAEDKEGILDVKILMNGNRKINIEIQVLPYAYWEERSLFYLAKHFVEGFEKGSSYNLLDVTIHISILVFPLFETGNWYSVIEFRDRKTQRLYSDKMSLRVLRNEHLVRFFTNLVRMRTQTLNEVFHEFSVCGTIKPDIEGNTGRTGVGNLCLGRDDFRERLGGA